MKEIHLAVAMRFHGECTDEQFEGFIYEIYTRLDEIGREMSLASRVRDRFAEFATIAQADDFFDAANAYLGDFRTALHAAGHNTARWPRLVPTEQTVREVDPQPV